MKASRLSRMIAYMLVILMYPIVCLSFDKDIYISGILGYPESLWKQSIVEIYTSGTGRGYIPESENSPTLVLKEGHFKMSSSGIIMKGANRKSYIITASHCVIPYQLFVSNYATQLRIIDSKIILVSGAGQANIMWTDEKFDIVVLTCSNNLSLKPSQYVASYTYVSNVPDYTLKEGDAVATIVGCRDKEGKRISGLEVRKGKVLSPTVTLKNDLTLEFFNKLDVITDIEVWPGDSGSPVFAFRNGVPYVIGIIRAVIRKADKSLHASYFVRIDPVVMFLETGDSILGDYSTK